MEGAAGSATQPRVQQAAAEGAASRPCPSLHLGAKLGARPRGLRLAHVARLQHHQRPRAAAGGRVAAAGILGGMWVLAAWAACHCKPLCLSNQPPIPEHMTLHTPQPLTTWCSAW